VLPGIDVTIFHFCYLSFDDEMRTISAACLWSLLVLHSTNVYVNGLSTPRPIRKVAIVGSGIAGLSLAHAFENSPDLFALGDGSPIEVTVYDARPSLNYEAGAGVQLNGGMVVIRFAKLMSYSSMYCTICFSSLRA
jgi:hypothetical protein